MGPFGRAVLVAGVLGATFSVGARAGQPPSIDGLPPLPPVRLGVVLGSDDPRKLDPAQLVPSDGRVNHFS